MLSTSGCKINDGNNIDVNFGTIFLTPNMGGDKPIQTLKKTVDFKCETSISVDVKFMLSSATASFSTEALPLSRKELGIKVFADNRLVTPGGTFAATMHQGHGSVPLSFDLVNDPKAKIPSGPFEGSAVLVMGLN